MDKSQRKRFTAAPVHTLGTSAFVPQWETPLHIST